MLELLLFWRQIGVRGEFLMGTKNGMAKGKLSMQAGGTRQNPMDAYFQFNTEFGKVFALPMDGSHTGNG